MRVQLFSHTTARPLALSSLLACALAALTAPAAAFTINIAAANPRSIYLQVGVGAFTANYNVGGNPRNNPTINTVTVTVPAAQVGSGAAQTMTTNSTVGQSFYDGFTFCTAGAQLYIGGFYRSVAAGGAATVRASVPANLVNGTGETIPFSQISWTSSGIGDGAAAQPFPAGTFTPGVQVIGTIQRNQWAESCHTFRYANTSVVAAGTYTGRVTYTLSTP